MLSPLVKFLMMFCTAVLELKARRLVVQEAPRDSGLGQLSGPQTVWAVPLLRRRVR